MALQAILVGFLTIPAAFLLGAYVWQLLPEKLSLRLSGIRFGFICAMLPLGAIAATAVGPGLERLRFHGALKSWLAGEKGRRAEGLLLRPLPRSISGHPGL